MKFLEKIKLSDIHKTYLRSSLTTFIATFSAFLIPQLLQIQNIDFSVLTTWAIVETLWRGVVRAIIIAMLPTFIELLTKFKKKVK